MAQRRRSSWPGDLMRAGGDRGLDRNPRRRDSCRGADWVREDLLHVETGGYRDSCRPESQQFPVEHRRSSAPWRPPSRAFRAPSSLGAGFGAVLCDASTPAPRVSRWRREARRAHSLRTPPSVLEHPQPGSGVPAGPGTGRTTRRMGSSVGLRAGQRRWERFQPQSLPFPRPDLVEARSASCPPAARLDPRATACPQCSRGGPPNVAGPYPAAPASAIVPSPGCVARRVSRRGADSEPEGSLRACRSAMKGMELLPHSWLHLAGRRALETVPAVPGELARRPRGCETREREPAEDDHAEGGAGVPCHRRRSRLHG